MLHVLADLVRDGRIETFLLGHLSLDLCPRQLFRISTTRGPVTNRHHLIQFVDSRRNTPDLF